MELNETTAAIETILFAMGDSVRTPSSSPAGLSITSILSK